jgi:hypothetical protein
MKKLLIGLAASSLCLMGTAVASVPKDIKLSMYFTAEPIYGPTPVLGPTDMLFQGKDTNIEIGMLSTKDNPTVHTFSVSSTVHNIKDLGIGVHYGLFPTPDIAHCPIPTTISNQSITYAITQDPATGDMTCAFG